MSRKGLSVALVNGGVPRMCADEMENTYDMFESARLAFVPAYALRSAVFPATLNMLTRGYMVMQHVPGYNPGLVVLFRCLLCCNMFSCGNVRDFSHFLCHILGFLPILDMVMCELAASIVTNSFCRVKQGCARAVWMICGHFGRKRLTPDLRAVATLMVRARYENCPTFIAAVYTTLQIPYSRDLKQMTTFPTLPGIRAYLHSCWDDDVQCFENIVYTSVLSYMFREDFTWRDIKAFAFSSFAAVCSLVTLLKEDKCTINAKLWSGARFLALQSHHAPMIANHMGLMIDKGYVRLCPSVLGVVIHHSYYVHGDIAKHNIRFGHVAWRYMKYHSRRLNFLTNE